jgi:hypothetical protein
VWFQADDRLTGAAVLEHARRAVAVAVVPAADPAQAGRGAVRTRARASRAPELAVAPAQALQTTAPSTGA